jgi:hypothetical protein
MMLNSSRPQPAANSAMIECLPGILRDVAAVTSLEAALTLSQRLGGRTIYIPRRSRQNSVIAQAIGTRMAARVSLIAGGEKVEVPRLKFSHRLAIATATGTHDEVALRFGVTNRWVRKVRADFDALSKGRKLRGNRRRQLPRRWAAG